MWCGSLPVAMRCFSVQPTGLITLTLASSELSTKIGGGSAGAAAAACAAQTVRQENRKAARRPFGRARNRKGEVPKECFRLSTARPDRRLTDSACDAYTVVFARNA